MASNYIQTGEASDYLRATAAFEKQRQSTIDMSAGISPNDASFVNMVSENIYDNTTPVSSSNVSPANDITRIYNQARNALLQGEQMSKQALEGKTSLASAVTELNKAELVVSAIVTTRDKIVEAYKAIAAMQI